MGTSLVEQLFGTRRCEFVDSDLVDVDEPGTDGAAKHADRTDAVEAHHVSDHVPYAPAITKRRHFPLLGRQRRQKIGEIGPLGSGHLETIHGITPSSRSLAGKQHPVDSNYAPERPHTAQGRWV